MTNPNTYGSAVVERDILTAALTRLCKVAVKPSNRHSGSIQILQHVLIAGEGDRLRIAATNLDLECVARIPASADPSLAVTVPAHALLNLLKKAKASDLVAIDWQGHSVEFDFGGLKVSIDSPLEADNFPVMAWTNDGASYSFDMETSDIANMIASVSQSISDEETRYYLNGIYWEPSFESNVGEISSLGSKTLRFVATDGHKLSVYRVPLPEEAEGMAPFILPRQTVEHIESLVSGRKTGGTCRITVAGGVKPGNEVTRFRIESGWYTYTSKLVDGVFPDYRRVMPSEHSAMVKVNRQELISAISEVQAVSSERGRAFKMTVFDDSLTLTVDNPDFGRASRSVSSELVFGEGMEIGFNSQYVVDLLQAIEGEYAFLKFSDPGAPATLTGDNVTRVYAHVIMPMRV